MSDTIWINSAAQLPAVIEQLDAAVSIGVDTEFLREKTFFPRLCVLQLASPTHIWCIDTLDAEILHVLSPLFTQTDKPKIFHAARQDLEAYYCTTSAIISPVFDTQIAAALIGMKPQVGYADLVKTLLDVNIAKSQTRTDWSRRPLSAAQLAYAADDVKYLHALAERLSARLRKLGREEWARADCALLVQQELYAPAVERAGLRLKGLTRIDASAVPIAFAIAAWRERLARERDLPRAWILSDADVLQLAQAHPRRLSDLRAQVPRAEISDPEAGALLECIEARPSMDAPVFAVDEAHPTAEQKKLFEVLASAVDARARELGIAAEILAPRAELKALALGRRHVPVLRGWRKEQIGERLQALLPQPIQTEVISAALPIAF